MAKIYKLIEKAKEIQKAEIRELLYQLNQLFAGLLDTQEILGQVQEVRFVKWKVYPHC